MVISGLQAVTEQNVVDVAAVPVIGFAAITFENGTLTSGGLNVQSNYGGEFVHKLTRSIQ